MLLSKAFQNTFGSDNWKRALLLFILPNIVKWCYSSLLLSNWQGQLSLHIVCTFFSCAWYSFHSFYYIFSPLATFSLHILCYIPCRPYSLGRGQKIEQRISWTKIMNHLQADVDFTINEVLNSPSVSSYWNRIDPLTGNVNNLALTWTLWQSSLQKSIKNTYNFNIFITKRKRKKLVGGIMLFRPLCDFAYILYKKEKLVY